MTTTRPTPPRTPGAGPLRGLRGATASTVLVARRRAGADVGLLALSAVLLAVTVALALLAPRLVLRSADHAVRQSVTAAGADADVVVQLPRTTDLGVASKTRDPNVATELRQAATTVADGLPPVLSRALNPPVSSIATSAGLATSTNAAGVERAVMSRLVYVTSGSQKSPVVWVQGRAPAQVPAPEAPVAGAPDDQAAAVEDAVHVIEVGLERGAASKLHITQGTQFTIVPPGLGKIVVRVSGLYTPVDPSSPVWTGVSDLLGASPAPAGSSADATVGFLLDPESLSDAKLWIWEEGFTTSFRFSVKPDAIDARSTQAIERSVHRVFATPDRLSLSGPPIVTSSLDTVLTDYDRRAAAANAQDSVLEVGLGGVGALALVLAARMLIGRRRTFLLAERARGASTLSVALRAAVESVPLAAGAAVVGAIAAWLIVPATGGSWTVAAVVALVAALAPPVTAAAFVHRAWAGKRLPANRVDRHRMLDLRRDRRITVELTLVVVAIAALVSVQRRGLLESATTHVDLLLAATPLLLAVAATIVLLHVMPPLLRTISRHARSRRGLVPVVATARASGASGTAVPLLTLTVAIALMVFCGTTVQTVRAGQSAAGDLVVGADVRVDGPVTEDDLANLRAQPGVTAVAAASLDHDLSLGTDTGLYADLEAVDAGQLVKILRAHGQPVDAGLTHLTGLSTSKVPALVSPSLRESTSTFTPSVLSQGSSVPIAVAGELHGGPQFEAVRPTGEGASDVVNGQLLVDRATFDKAHGAGTIGESSATGGDGPRPKPLDITTVWVDGPGAAAAVQTAGLAGRNGIDVTTHAGWISAARTSALNEALVAMLVGTGLTLALFAAMALVLTVVATSGERGRTISTLRTLGLDARTARALTFGELAPLATAAVVAGTLIGVAVPSLLTHSLGLSVATGGPRDVTIAVSWVWPALAAVVVVASLVVAVRVESAVRRRDRLGEVLRVGER
jgi:putative ABC transport system permease protein